MKKLLHKIMLITMLVFGMRSIAPAETVPTGIIFETFSLGEEQEPVRAYYYQYLRELLVSGKVVLADLESTSATVSKYEDPNPYFWTDREGLLSADFADFDQDGTEEMVLFVMHHPHIVLDPEKDWYWEINAALYDWNNEQGVWRVETKNLETGSNDWDKCVTLGIVEKNEKPCIYSESLTAARVDDFHKLEPDSRYNILEYFPDGSWQEVYVSKTGSHLYTQGLDADGHSVEIEHDRSESVQDVFSRLKMPCQMQNSSDFDDTFPTMAGMEGFHTAFQHRMKGVHSENETFFTVTLEDKTNLRNVLNRDNWKFSFDMEKGKTILTVSAESAPSTDDVYWLCGNIENGSAYSWRMKSLEPGNNYTATFDLSTELNLRTGSYLFGVETTDHSKSWMAQKRFDYDEELKCIDDDRHGNEREYRRLVKNEVGAEENPLNNINIYNNMKSRLEDVEIPEKVISGILDNVRDANYVARNLFVYSFYQYNIERTDRTSYYAPDRNQLTYGKTKNNDDQFTFFHELGHTIDYNAAAGNSYGTVDDGQWQIILDKMINDFQDIVNIELKNWIKQNDKKNNINFEELSENITYALIGSRNMEVKTDMTGYLSVYALDPEDFTEAEKDAYRTIIKSLSDSLKSLKFNNGNMAMDVFAGMTNNKINGNSWVNDYGHGPGVNDNQEYYWFKQDGSIHPHILEEAWAEYFSAFMVGDVLTHSVNKEYFTSTCAYFEELAQTYLERYLEKF